MALPGFFIGREHTPQMAQDSNVCSACPEVNNCERRQETKQYYLHAKRMNESDIPVKLTRKILVCGTSKPYPVCQE